MIKGFNVIGSIQQSWRNQGYNSYNPFTGEQIGNFPESGMAEVQEACIEAEKAFKTWKNVPAPVRGKYIGNLAKLLEKHKASLASLITDEIGKPIVESEGSVQEAIDTTYFFQSEGRRLYGQTVHSELPNKDLLTYRKPYGVCGIITAGNFPVAVPSWKIIPAVLCGNTIVWKPSPDSPAVSQYFCALLLASGLPTGVINMVHGGWYTGQCIINEVERGKIQKISFTGSTEVGRQIGVVCGKRLQTPSLELGGKNPMIVTENANMNLAIEGAIFSGYATAGQRCTSLANLIVHEEIYEDFKDRLIKAIDKIKVGNPHNRENLYGALISEKFLKLFNQHFRYAEVKNVHLLRGEPSLKSMCVKPALWEILGPRPLDNPITFKEIFGPTINLIKYKKFNEAIDIANGTTYGLSSSIYTTDMYYANTFKNEIQSGMCSINNSTVGAEAHLPFGGIKESGNGTRESGQWVIDSYTYWQSVNIDNSDSLQKAQIETQTPTINEEPLKSLGDLWKP